MCFKFIQMTWPKNCLVYSPHTHSFMYSYYKDVTCLKLYSILLSSQTSRPTTRRSLMVEANIIHIPDRETAESAAATFCLGSCGNGGIKNGLVLSSCCITYRLVRGVRPVVGTNLISSPSVISCFFRRQ